MRRLALVFAILASVSTVEQLILPLVGPGFQACRRASARRWNLQGAQRRLRFALPKFQFQCFPRTQREPLLKE